jgi:beta-xylosidase
MILRKAMFGLCLMQLCGAPPAPPPTILDFRDDFQLALAPGWTILRPDPSHYTLAERPGYLRIYTQQGSLAQDTVQNLFLRDFAGDFTLETRLEFDPTGSRQLAGLVVQNNGGEGVSFGLTRASGPRGVFRGLALLAAQPDGAEAERAAVSYPHSTVVLRLRRSGNQFTASYSQDGSSFSPLRTLTSPMDSTVKVGLGAGNGEDCGEDCDLTTPADFEYFQVSIPE